MTTNCITCAKRLSVVNRAENGNQCAKCFAAALREQADLKAAAEREVAREAHAARVAARHDDPELLGLAVETALSLQSAHTNLVSAYQSIAKNAASRSERVTLGGLSWGLGSCTTDASRHELEVRLHAEALRKLLHLMGRSDDFDAMVAAPWDFLWKHNNPQN